MSAQAFVRLDALPRERLSLAPTPFAPASRLAHAIGVDELWIKHDELMGFGFGGNKVRGLELLIADARAQAADVIVTGAGSQSNHVRATAAAAAHAGMEAVAVYWGLPPTETTGNLRLTRRLGAHTRFTGSLDRTSVDQGISDAVTELRAKARKPYAIPRGGACPLGVLGHVLAARELHLQAMSQGVRPDVVMLAVGSGATLAGWLLGSALLGRRWRVEGVAVSRPAAETRSRVVELAAGAAALLGLKPLVRDADIVVHDNFIGDGYGIPTAAGEAAIDLAARTQGVFLDPTYTGKAFAALWALSAMSYFNGQSTVVFVHTGGEPGLFADPHWTGRR